MMEPPPSQTPGKGIPHERCAKMTLDMVKHEVPYHVLGYSWGENGPLWTLLPMRLWGGVLNPSGDPFEIISGEISEDCLKIDVRYGGGCKDHDFVLYYEPLRDFSAYSGLLLLSHDADGDLCEALITESLYFDLTSVQDTSTAMVRLRLQPDIEGSEDYLLIDYYYQ